MFRNIICMLFVAALVPMSGSVAFADTNKHKDVQSLVYEFENGEKSAAEAQNLAVPRRVIMAPAGRPADCCDTVYYPRCYRPAVVYYAVPAPCYVAPQPCCRPVPYVPYYPYYGYRRCRW